MVLPPQEATQIETGLAAFALPLLRTSTVVAEEVLLIKDVDEAILELIENYDKN